MGNYFDTGKKYDCNGCGICSLRCPKHAITMVEDDEGFLYPYIEESKCIKCGLCKIICSNNPIGDNKEDTYVAIVKNNDVLLNSSSGGMFYPIAKYIIENSGVVFGCKFDENLVAIHDYTENLDGLIDFQGSKYVRSDLKDSYKKVEEFLDAGRYVLFSGTPCQCAGARNFLKKKYDKFITVEIICHCNASPKVFEMYKKNLVNTKYKSGIKSIIFRDKKTGWHNQSTTIIDNNNNKRIEKNVYFDAFVQELIDRPSCYDCRFCSTKRYSDFTIGDAWGINKIDSSIKDDNKGISILNVNTDKARYIFEHINDEIITKKVDTELAFSFNHNKNVPFHPKREEFFYKIKNNIIDETNIIVYLKKYTKRPLIVRIKNKCKSILKKILRRY